MTPSSIIGGGVAIVIIFLIFAGVGIWAALRVNTSVRKKVVPPPNDDKPESELMFIWKDSLGAPYTDGQPDPSLRITLSTVKNSLQTLGLRFATKEDLTAGFNAGAQYWSYGYYNVSGNTENLTLVGGIARPWHSSGIVNEWDFPQYDTQTGLSVLPTVFTSDTAIYSDLSRQEQLLIFDNDDTHYVPIFVGNFKFPTNGVWAFGVKPSTPTDGYAPFSVVGTGNYISYNDDERTYRKIWKQSDMPPDWNVRDTGPPPPTRYRVRNLVNPVPVFSFPGVNIIPFSPASEVLQNLLEVIIVPRDVNSTLSDVPATFLAMINAKTDQRYTFATLAQIDWAYKRGLYLPIPLGGARTNCFCMIDEGGQLLAGNFIKTGLWSTSFTSGKYPNPAKTNRSLMGNYYFNELFHYCLWGPRSDKMNIGEFDFNPLSSLKSIYTEV